MIEQDRGPAATSPSFELLVERESPSVLAYFVRRVEPAADAADLLAEVLLVAWRRRAAVPGDATEARMWLFGVARKVLSNHRRSRIRHDALAERLRWEMLVTEQSAAADAQRDEALALLATLTALDREIVTLVYWEGFRLDEVARILGRNPSTIRARHARALAALRRRSSSLA